MGYPVKKRKKPDDTAVVVAGIHEVSTRYVNLVRNGDRENEAIMATCVEYEIGKSNLIRTLEQMVAITPQPEKYARKKK